MRVELKGLTANELERVLTEPQFNLLEQYRQLLKAEEITLEFEGPAVKEFAKTASEMNMLLENTGARRLYGIVEKGMVCLG